MAHEQDQFLNVVDRDTAERRWWDAIHPEPLGPEVVPLATALGRVLADDVAADVDVPAFDRSNVDGYALRAEETYGAAEETPRRLRLNPEELATGVVPRRSAMPGTATPIATGGMLPRGADAVLMVEHAWIDGDDLVLLRPVAPGAHVSFAGTDVARGELVLRRGTVLTARETGLLAAIGRAEVEALRRPRVAILSTGDEVIAPGTPSRPASVYDANATLLADAVRELGGEPVPLGIVGDDEAALEAALERGLAVSRRGPSERRHEQGRRRPLVPHPGPSVAGDRCAWRGPQAGQADLPRRGGDDPGGDPAGLPDLGHLHLPRVRRPGLAADGGTRPRGPRRDRSHDGPAVQQRARADRVSAGWPRPRPGRAVGLSDGQGFGLGDDLQPGRRFHRHPEEPGIRRARRAGGRHAAGPGDRGGRPGGDRLALRRARPATWAPGRAWVPLQDALGRLARGPRRGGPGRVRRGGRPPARPQDRHLQRHVPARRRPALAWLRPDARAGLPAGRRPHSKEARSGRSDRPGLCRSRPA